MNEDRCSWLHIDGRRFTLRSNGGQLILYAPPHVDLNASPQFRTRNTDDIRQLTKLKRKITQQDWNDSRPTFRPGVDLTLAQLIAGLNNDQIDWKANYWNGVGQATVLTYYGARSGTAAEQLRPRVYSVVSDSKCEFIDPPPFADADTQVGLLLALEDPKRFVAAHLLLNRLPLTCFELTEQQYGLFTTSIDGLQVRAALVKYGRNRRWDAEPQVAAEQLGAIRDQWHRRLDIEVMSAPYWLLMLMTGILPLWIAQSASRKFLRRRARQRSGHCVNCGFDLRASEERCPECGTPCSSPALLNIK